MKSQTKGEGVDHAGSILRPGETCWRRVHAHRLAVIVDAADYFRAAREAMLRAEHSILLIGWDFDLRIELTPGEDDDRAPDSLGDFLRAIVRRKRGLRIWILKWDMAVFFTLGHGLLTYFRSPMAAMKRIRLRFDSTHPWMAAHHQKIVVIDDALAFCGGIDMTTDRWDTRDHAPSDRRRTRPDGRISGPWHDATTVVDGEAARALGELARERWRRATGRKLRAPEPVGDIWPGRVAPQFRDVEVAIARTFPGHDGRPAVNEIEQLHIAAIRAAKRSIYLESQYFASASICQEIAARLQQPDGPEVVVVNPLSAEGWLEEQTMGSARDLWVASIREADRFHRFGIFHPVNAAGEPIYVHAKILIVDDRLIRVGSSNVNNRSMGFDSECDLAIEAATAADGATVTTIRNDLLAEHLDVTAAEVAEAMAGSDSVLDVVGKLNRAAGRSLRPLPTADVNVAQALLANSHFADPERPARVETRAAHLAKRLALRVPPSAWAALGAAGLAAYLYRRRKRRG